MIVWVMDEKLHRTDRGWDGNVWRFPCKREDQTPLAVGSDQSIGLVEYSLGEKRLPFRCRATPRLEHRYRRSFRLSQTPLPLDAGWSESLAGKAQAAQIGSGIAYILAVFPEAKERLIPGFRCAAG